jgi:serine/threonine protein kinase/tetratricopeptide (TPR) repeat protein
MINDRFFIKKKLGEGRSKVFLCSDNALPAGQAGFPGKDVAIKILSKGTGRQELQAFKEEFFTLKKLNHPNIINAYEIGTIVKLNTDNKEITEGSKFFTLDYFDGVNLLYFPGLKNEENLKEIITQLCSVLYYLHQSNYIYYDLKAENILAAESNSKPVIKMIDMGLAGHLKLKNELSARGTAEYLAPEILKKQPYDHRIDLYSLGILLYRILYNRFPFKAVKQLDIYKAHLEEEFDFPEPDFYPGLIEVVKKLLKKDPSERYYNTLQILNDLNIPIEIISDELMPAKVFADRSDALSGIQNYITGSSAGEVYTIKGIEGSGKTSLAYKIFSEFDNVVFTGHDSTKSGIESIKDLLKKIVYSDFVYPGLSPALLTLINDFLNSNEPVNVDRIKSVFSRLSSEADFIIVYDDFNSIDEFSLDIYKEIFPILQVNKTKIILTENSGISYLSGIIFNLKEINLTPFTEAQLEEYLDLNFAPFFPKDNLKNQIMLHADLLPGSIESFIQDLILLKILVYTTSGTIITADEAAIALLKSSHDEIYKLRVSRLSEDELKTAQLISSLEVSVEPEMISELSGLNVKEIISILSGLKQKNVLHLSNMDLIPVIVSEGLKKYIYSTIKNAAQFHKKIALIIKNKHGGFSRSELSRQFELAEEYTESYNVLKDELTQAEKLSAFSYQKKIIQHLLELPLNESFKFDLKYILCGVFRNLNDPRSSLNLIEELLLQKPDNKILNELLILKGMCLIELREIESGKQIFKSLISKISDKQRHQKLLVEIAYAEFDLKSYEIAEEMCKEIINNENSGEEEKGKCYNLLGLIDTYKDYNLDSALTNFENAREMYHAANLTLNEAKAEVNIGNISFWKGDYENAEKHWNRSLQTNLSIGNLDQEAQLLLSLGIFYYNKTNYDKAIEHYKRAHDIFQSLGNRNGQGLVLFNSGETYLAGCEYQNAFEYLSRARDIFRQLVNTGEEAEVLFLLGKFYFILGDNKVLNTIIRDYRDLIKKNVLPEKHNNNLEYLEVITSPNQVQNKDHIDNFKKVLNTFKKQNEKNFFVEGSSILCKDLIRQGMYEDAINLLNDPEFSNICTENLFYNAERLYLLALLASVNNNLKLPPPIESLEKAFNYIRDEHITELTWKLLFSLAENYFQRGNFKKSEEYVLYSKRLLNFIAENITDENMKKTYLSKPERKSALEKLEYMESKL